MFMLSEKQKAQLEAWRLDLKARRDSTLRDPLGGAAGGRWTYEFTPTGIGEIVVRCGLTGEHIDLTDFDSW
jgi:hypothetical protein